jgi:SAM-dependent MidA family methyltransferase
VETSPPLRARQAQVLAAAPGVQWAESLGAVAGEAPMVVLANEFLDCLPIDQWTQTPDGWRERRIGVDDDGALGFVATGFGPTFAPPPCWSGAPLGAVAETSTDSTRFAERLAARVRQEGGAALLIDYGRDQPGWGDTLQALRRHRKEGPLEHPGEADLTAHVDFPAFAAAARRAGAMVGPLQTQGDFLRRRGAEERAQGLARAHPHRAAAIERQIRRLIGEDGMGELFKVATLWTPMAGDLG